VAKVALLLTATARASASLLNRTIEILLSWMWNAEELQRHLHGPVERVQTICKYGRCGINPSLPD